MRKILNIGHWAALKIFLAYKKGDIILYPSRKSLTSIYTFV